MAKPRIIIADTDVGYILPLQRKFAEEFFEKVELEIITDRADFNAKFATPQQAEVLIVSEDLYDSSLQRHNITHCFLMTESQREEGGTGGRFYPVFKYSSIKEVFVEIVGKSGSALAVGDTLRNASRLLVVSSAAGGVGKTTVAMGVCAALTRNYKKVLYINAQRLQTFQHMLSNPAPIGLSGIYPRYSSNSREIYQLLRTSIRQEGFDYLPPFKLALMSLGLPYRFFLNVAEAARESGDYDFVVVDTDTCLDEDKASLMNAADKVVLITNQSVASVVATNALVSNINGISPEKYIFVCNNFDKEQPNALELSHIPLKFTVSEYVESIPSCQQIGVQALSKHSDIQRLAFLIS